MPIDKSVNHPHQLHDDAWSPVAAQKSAATEEPTLKNIAPPGPPLLHRLAEQNALLAGQGITIAMPRHGVLIVAIADATFWSVYWPHVCRRFENGELMYFVRAGHEADDTAALDVLLAQRRASNPDDDEPINRANVLFFDHADGPEYLEVLASLPSTRSEGGQGNG